MSPQGGSLPLFILVPLAPQEAPSGSLSLHSFDTIFVAQGYGVTYGFMPSALFGLHSCVATFVAQGYGVAQHMASCPWHSFGLHCYSA